MSALSNLFPHFDVISFDVFDTLLMRPFVRPSDLFWKMERDFDAPGFAKARIRAENRVRRTIRQQGREEPLFDEIYAEIPRWSGMAARELAAERACLSAVPEALVLWNEAKAMGKTVVITSDMYLPEDFIQSVLRENGFDGWDAFYLSCSRQARKGNGTLYKRLCADFPAISPERILHIGDNRDSDVDRAVAEGLVSVLLPSPFERFLAENPFVRNFLGPRPSLDKRLLAGALASGWTQFRAQHPDGSYWNKIGFLFAGVLGTAYMRFVADDAQKRGIRHLMFVARDGYILQKIFRVLRPDLRTDYFFASRDQALFASRYFGRTALGVSLRRKRALSVLHETAGIDLDSDARARYLAGGDLPAEARAAMDRISEQMRTEAADYLAPFAIEPGTTAVVDGNSVHFTAQRFVESIVGAPVPAYYLFTLGPVSNGASFYCADWAPRYHQFSEFLFGAPTPPVHTVRDGKPVWKEDLPFFERFKMSVCDEIAKGAVATAIALERFGAPATHPLWQDWCDAFFDNQGPEDAERLSLARNSIAVGHDGSFEPVAAPLRPDHRVRLFGRTLFALRRVRRGETQFREVLLFGRHPLFRIPRRLWRGLSTIAHAASRIPDNPS